VARYVPWRDAGGAIGGVIGFHTVVTERRRRAMFVRALESIGQSLTSSLDLNETLDTIVNRALEVMAADAALVVAWDGHASTFTVLRAAGRLSDQYASAGSVPVGGGPMSRAILNGTAVTTPDILHDPETWLVAERRTQVEREGFRAVGAAPLRSKGRVHGALVVHYWTVRRLSEEDMAALQLLAEHAALAIDNARVYADATRRAERLRELTDLEQLVTESLVVDDVLRRIAQATARLLDAPIVQLWTADPAERVVRLSASSVEPGLPEVRMPRIVPFGEGVVGMRPGALGAVHLYDAARGVLRAEALSGAEWDGLPIERPANVGLPGVVFEAQTPVLVPQPLTHPRSIARDWWQKRPKGTYYGVPIAVGETFVGVLDYILPDGLPDAEEQEALRLLAAQAGIALRNAGLYQTERVQAERIRALAAVNQQMSSTLDLDELLRTICESAAALIGVRFVAFWLADEHARTVTLASTSEPEIAGDAPRRMASY